jgi:hypothetical protein
MPDRILPALKGHLPNLAVDRCVLGHSDAYAGSELALIRNVRIIVVHGKHLCFREAQEVPCTGPSEEPVEQPAEKFGITLVRTYVAYVCHMHLRHIHDVHSDFFPVCHFIPPQSLNFRTISIQGGPAFVFPPVAILFSDIAFRFTNLAFLLTPTSGTRVKVLPKRPCKG